MTIRGTLALATCPTSPAGVSVKPPAEITRSQPRTHCYSFGARSTKSTLTADCVDGHSPPNPGSVGQLLTVRLHSGQSHVCWPGVGDYRSS